MHGPPAPDAVCAPYGRRTPLGWAPEARARTWQRDRQEPLPPASWPCNASPFRRPGLGVRVGPGPARSLGCPSWVGWHRALPGLRAEVPGGRAGMPTARSFPGRMSKLVPTIAHLRPIRAANREAERPGKDSPKVTPRAVARGPVPRAPPGGRDPPRRVEGPEPFPRARGWRGRRAELGAGRAGRAGLPGTQRPAGSAPRRPPPAPPAAPATPRPPQPRGRDSRGARGKAGGAGPARGSAPGNALGAPRRGGGCRRGTAAAAPG